MFNKLKEIKDLKKQANDIKNSMAQEAVTGEALGGDIKITMNGNQEIQAVEVSESLLSPGNKEDIERGIKDAFSKANKELQSLMMRKMQSGEIQMPSM